MEQTRKRLAGKTAIVTGASRGLGRVIAAQFAAEGANVVVAARTEEQHDERLPGSVHDTVDEIVAAGGKATAFRCNVASEDDCGALVRHAHDTYGPVDVLVNNAALTTSTSPSSPSSAGVGGANPTFCDLPLKAYRLHFEVGVFAAYRLIQLVLPDMMGRGAGWIVNISSHAARLPSEGPYNLGSTTDPVMPGYGGNKLVLEHLTRCVAAEVAAYGIAINAVVPSVALSSPGLTALGVYDGADPADFGEAVVQLAFADVHSRTGTVVYHRDLLSLGRPARGWQG